jgi:predicted O-methyltransferase YrrM
MKEQSVRSLIVGAAAGTAGAGITALGAGVGVTPLAAAWPVFAICVVIGALIHNAKGSANDLIDNRTQTLKRRLERIRRDVGDVHGLVRLAPYTQSLPLPIGGGWALTGDSAALLAREALCRKPDTVLELGSGVSTLILGQILKRNGKGRLLSVDHDPVWANQTRRYVEFLGLGDVVSVVDAPLKNLALGGRTVNWYDIPRANLDALGTIDLLVVDGPPQAKDDPEPARYPAFPMLRERLSPRALVVVDDADRETERKMVEKWIAESPEWRAQRFDTVDGVCILEGAPEC